MPHVHAIIVHHRGKEMLGGALESLLGSRDVELEIVLVANDCQEELPEIVAAFEKIHRISTPRALGFSAANNFGVSWARENLGEPDNYYFVNNDTWSDPEALATLVRALEEDPEAAVAGPQLRILGACDHLNSLGLNLTADAWGWDEGIGVHLDDYGPLPTQRPMIAVTGSALLAEAAAYREVGGWTEVYDYYFEDLDLCLKVWERGRKVLQVPEALVLHQISATMTVGSERKEFLFWRNRLMLAVVHWPLPLLMSVFHRAIVTEILSNRWADNRMQRRALKETLGRLPRLLRQRLRCRGDRSWRRFLHPPGSVPVITLPEVDPSAGNGGKNPAVTDESLPAELLDRVRELQPGADLGRRVLVVGFSPLPFQNQRMSYAPGVRSWQLARPLVDDGHAVCLVCGRIPGAYDPDALPVETFEHEGVLCVTLDRPLFESDAVLEDLAAAFAPDVVVGAAALPSRRAVRVAGELPLWVDVFGDPMAEAQAKATVDSKRDHLGAYWHLLMELLGRGDAFGVVSERQKYALLGQLGLAGRLSKETAGAELIHTIPCCAIAGSTPEGGAADLPEVAEDDFVVLWSGGYNTWSDVDTLFAALELAMERRPELRFLSTAGGIPGHDEDSYARFRALAEGSRFRDRFVFKGFLPEREAARVFRRADLGVLTEKVLAERHLGSSGRILRWMADGLPFVCTRLSELGEQVEAQGLGWTYPPGDAAALAERIVAAASNPDKLRETGRRAREHAERHLTAAATTEPLRRWVVDSRRAPDHDLADTRQRGLSIELRTLRARLEEVEDRLTQMKRENDDLVEKTHRLRSELGGIHESKMWGIWMGYLRFRRLLLWPFRR